MPNGRKYAFLVQLDMLRAVGFCALGGIEYYLRKLLGILNIDHWSAIRCRQHDSDGRWTRRRSISRQLRSTEAHRN